MSNSGESHLVSTEYSVAGESSFRQSPLATATDPRVPLLNLEIVRMRMDSLQRFLAESVNTNTVISTDQMDTVSAEIGSAIHQIIVNGAALLSCSSSRDSSFLGAGKPYEPPDLKFPPSELKIVDEEAKIEIDSVSEVDCEIVELDAVELLAEHIHFCEICGKGFKRDANLRMHMRAHGNQYKTPEALAKPEQCVIESNRKTRFSCPYAGCTRNKSHKKFRPLKSVICVKNHFKRSHCPKMYACNRCNRKSFSVVADLKSHLRHCGEAKWRCSCGTSFSRKDKLFGHIGLFEGHMPAVVAADDEEQKSRSVMAMEEDDQDEKLGVKCTDKGFFDGLFDELGEIENYSLEDMWGNDMDSGMEKFIEI